MLRQRDWQRSDSTCRWTATARSFTVSLMPSWSDFEAAAPELAESVRERLDAHTHKTLATVRSDGSPRISGTETELKEGELWIGSMWQARKAHDLQRDPRFALHSGSDEPAEWKGDAKLAGVAEEITDPERVAAINGGKAPPGPSHLFRLDLREVSTVALDESRKALAITVWTPERGVRTIKRA
jgi:Pyridoxamine 5'-phosphate oxidase